MKVREFIGIRSLGNKKKMYKRKRKRKRSQQAERPSKQNMLLQVDRDICRTVMHYMDKIHSMLRGRVSPYLVSLGRV